MWCDVCGDEELVLTCEIDKGACQSCQQEADRLMIPVEDLCRGCKKREGGDEAGTGRPLCDECRAEADADRAEFLADLAADR